MQNLEDDVCQTLDDLISEKFCECAHEIKIHEKGEITNTVKCFGMVYNGISLSSCKCTAIRVAKFEIEVKVDATNL